MQTTRLTFHDFFYFLSISFSLFPTAKANKDGKLETCKPIHKVDLRTTKMGWVGNYLLISNILHTGSLICMRADFVFFSNEIVDLLGWRLDFICFRFAFSLFFHSAFAAKRSQFFLVDYRPNEMENRHALQCFKVDQPLSSKWSIP